MNCLLCISLNSRGVKDEWAWKPGTELYASHKHSLQIFIRVLKHLCMKCRNKDNYYISWKTSAAWKALLHMESVGSLGSESCYGPRSQVGKNTEKTSSTLAQSKGEATLSLCQTIAGKGWEVQSSQAVAHALIYLRDERQECCAGGWEQLPMLICQWVHIFGFLHGLFSLDGHLEEYFCSAGFFGVKAPKGSLPINREWPYREYSTKNFCPWTNYALSKGFLFLAYILKRIL